MPPRSRAEAQQQRRKVSGGSSGGGSRGKGGGGGGGGSGRGSLGSFSAHGGGIAPTMPAVEEIRSLLERGEIATLFSRGGELEECDAARLSSSLVNIPTYINNRDRVRNRSKKCSIDPPLRSSL